MGLSAHVNCNCYQEGKATPCPYPDDFLLDPLRGPSLTLDYAGNEGKYERFWDWLKSSCEHFDMKHVSVFVASWKGYQEFEDALTNVGTHLFPVLMTELPDGDGKGVTSPEQAQLALDELDAFDSMEAVDERPVLVDTERGIDVSMGSHVLGGALTIDRVSGFDLGFDKDGFFIRDRWELNRDLFRAMHVRQHLIHPESHGVEYEDVATGLRFPCSAPFGKVITDEEGLPRMFLREFHIDIRPTHPDRFVYITQPLRQVFQASIETQNPVRWS